LRFGRGAWPQRDCMERNVSSGSRWSVGAGNLLADTTQCGDGSGALRGAAWESKWRAMEAELQMAVADELVNSKSPLPQVLKIAALRRGGPATPMSTARAAAEDGAADCPETARSLQQFNDFMGGVRLSELHGKQRRKLQPTPRQNATDDAATTAKADDVVLQVAPLARAMPAQQNGPTRIQSIAVQQAESFDVWEAPPLDNATAGSRSDCSRSCASPRSCASRSIVSREGTECAAVQDDEVSAGSSSSPQSPRSPHSPPPQQLQLSVLPLWASDATHAEGSGDADSAGHGRDARPMNTLFVDPLEAQHEVSVSLAVDELLRDAPPVNSSTDHGDLTKGVLGDAVCEDTLGVYCNEAGVAEAAQPLTSLPQSSLRTMHRLWCLLVLLSILECTLVVAGIAADQFWSPCRKPLSDCHSLHEEDCSGASCRDAVPVWAPSWPAAGLLCIALPLRLVLRGRGGGRLGLVLPVLVAASAAVGMGVMILAQLSTAGLEYASRCPMERAAGRCTADTCPSPPCRRENEFSPCVCGRLGEAEMARALFVKSFAACQPYEWYDWQMTALEEIILQYENFACLAGPLTCLSAAIGAVLLLVQLACCPLLFLGHCGLDHALLVLFATDEELDRLIIGKAPASIAAPNRARLEPEAGPGVLAEPPALRGLAEGPPGLRDGASSVAEATQDEPWPPSFER